MKVLEVSDFLSEQLHFIRRRSKTPAERQSLDWWLNQIRELSTQAPGQPQGSFAGPAKRKRGGK